MGVWWAISTDFMDIKYTFFTSPLLDFFRFKWRWGEVVRLVAVVWVLTYAIIYLDFIATPHSHTHDTRYHVYLFSKWVVGGWVMRASERCVRLIRTYGKYHERILPMTFFFAAAAAAATALAATFPFGSSFFCNYATEYTAKARVEHFNAQFTTINTLKSSSASLCGFEVWQWRVSEKKILRDIELTIKQ